MKVLQKFLLFIVLFNLISCNLDTDCGECFTPPEAFLFNLVEKETETSIFFNDNYNTNEIEVINLEDSTDIQFAFIDENNYNLIQVNSIGWVTEKVSAMVRISNQDIFSFYVDAERREQDCCTYTHYNEIRIDSVEFEYDFMTGIFKIYIENQIK